MSEVDKMDVFLEMGGILTSLFREKSKKQPPPEDGGQK